jgi:hypothetical protein
MLIHLPPIQVRGARRWRPRGLDGSPLYGRQPRVLAMSSPTQGLLRRVARRLAGRCGLCPHPGSPCGGRGGAPGPVRPILLAGLTGLAMLLTGVRLSLVRVGVSLTAVQVVLHEAFKRLNAPPAWAIAGMRAPAGGQWTWAVNSCLGLSARAAWPTQGWVSAPCSRPRPWSVRTSRPRP